MATELVYIGKILDLVPVPDAEKIELATVVCGKGGKWRGIVKKGQYQTGDLARTYLPDSLLPHDDEFAFMEKYKWRVRQMRFRGVPSECLIMPGPVSNEKEDGNGLGIIGRDITDWAKVTKYFKPIPASLEGIAIGNFPSFIPKTDEPNYQTVPYMLEALKGQRFYSTEKVDGGSATIYWKDEHFGICSRNQEIAEPNMLNGRRPVNNAIWDIARRYNLKEKMSVYTDCNTAIQFEVIGPGIQKNPSGLRQIEPRLFSVWDIDAQEYWSGARVRHLSENLKIPMVNILLWDEEFTQDYIDLLPLQAEGEYENGHQREGIVVRPMIEQYIGRERLSFKIVNLLYKDNLGKS